MTFKIIFFNSFLISNKSALYLAIEEGSIEIVKLLLTNYELHFNLEKFYEL